MLIGGFAMWWLFETLWPSTNNMQPYQIVIHAAVLAGISLFWGSSPSTSRS